MRDLRICKPMTMSMFFDSLWAILRIVVIGIPSYLVMIVALRLAGKRALAKMNAYGLVVTIALGSMLASTFLTKDIALIDGVVAIATLLTLQWIVAFAVVRWPFLQNVTTSEPELMLYDGKPLRDVMERGRVHIGQLESAVRSAGHMSFADIQAVVLEPDGSFSVIPRQDPGDASAMEGVSNYDVEKKALKNRES